ncbi:hypothetical protein Suden_0399 [Sulfurimonas denitrificans DSM 1251]|uniref:DUF3570 domain-containing protein n=1 Tax=Sulfurimonas denitrificans (strain ATCC 33889 / DSM 1251) TaxID=326298 RepID=Q30TK1_SULDN|nr:hypothetical protein [Sulfurimonas denitrificans]ABB43680.1 hypothetical protein Suden_0399 [Sulfurimonas denitrificans DSM 1251]MDD3442702.1 hypothetical protein [Sulfurimonas denitrificans]
MLFRIIIFLFCFFYANAQTLQQKLDEKQEKISNYVIEVFDDIDKKIAYWVHSEDGNITTQSQTKNSVDEFFKGEKYIKETNKSYLQFRLKSLLQSKGDSSITPYIKAQIPLQRSQKNFQIFFSEIKKDALSQSVSQIEDEKSAQVGVSYFTPMQYDIKSKYSVGLRSLSTYASARYSKEFEFNKWLIEPTQEFKYSTKYNFSEETNIYFDRALDESSLFRTTLHRKTQENTRGYDYALSLSYYLTPSYKKGFGVSQIFWGNSKYSCDMYPEEYSGISNYATQFSWRQNILRKWIAYEVQPIVSFHREHNYEANYMLRFYLDFYFGNID